MPDHSKSLFIALVEVGVLRRSPSALALHSLDRAAPSWRVSGAHRQPVKKACDKIPSAKADLSFDLGSALLLPQASKIELLKAPEAQSMKIKLFH